MPNATTTSATASELFQSRYRAAFHFRIEVSFIEVSFYVKFQSRYRAAFHFRFTGNSFEAVVGIMPFQSRYRAAFHFRQGGVSRLDIRYPGFNLVIERLFISGTDANAALTAPTIVSISLSSGFSFQGNGCHILLHFQSQGFNLVIERLFISG